MKSRFLNKTEHPLLGKPYPAHLPTPIWNEALGRAAGHAIIELGVIELNPSYLLPLEREAHLKQVLLHEMLHVYCWFIHKYNGERDRNRGHGGPWRAIAQVWNLPPCHNLDEWKTDGSHNYTPPLMKAPREDVFYCPDRYQKHRRLP